MDTIEIKIQLPKAFIKGIPDLSKYTYEKLILGLYLDNEISFGKAAKLLNFSYDQFLEYLDKHKIPYFNSEPDDIKSELNKLSGI
jgi:predicted HTH domain antitoxin